MSRRPRAAPPSRALALAALAAAPAAHAVPFAPDDPAGWWQLQDPLTYEQLCSASDAACDVAPGTYTLIDFGESPARRTSVTVVAPPTGPDAPPTGSPAGPRFVQGIRTCEASVDGAEQVTCTLACPAGELVAASCYRTDVVGRAAFPAWTRTIDGEVRCGAWTDELGGFARGETLYFVATMTCAE